MKFILAAIGLLLTLLVTGQTGATVTTTIHGNVSDFVTKKPIKEATIILYADEVELKRVKTDARGNYSFGQLAAGNYDMRFEASGYEMQERKKLPLQNKKKVRVVKLLQPKQTGNK